MATTGNSPYARCATALFVLAALTAGPAAWVVVERLSRPLAAGAVLERVDAWVYWTLFLALLEAAYGLYVLQVRHAGSLRVVSGLMLVVAAISAALFAGTLFGGASGWAATVLQVADQLPQRKGPQLGPIPNWCLLLLVVSTGISVWSGAAAHAARARSAP